MARTKHPDADWLRSLKLRPKGEAVYIWQYKEEGPCNLSIKEKWNGLTCLFAGERRREPGSRQQNSSLLQLQSCAQRSPSPTHKWVEYPSPTHKWILDSTHFCPAPDIPPLTQPHLTQTWKRQGTANPPRQKTRSQYLQQLWNTTTRWVGGGQASWITTIPLQAQQLDELSLVKGSRVSWSN